METIFGLEAAKERLLSYQKARPRVATLGVFDGVHLGHKKVIAETMSWAKRLRGLSIAVTFEPHPEALIKGESPSVLTSLQERLMLLGFFGLDFCVVINFDRKMARKEPEEFVKEVLVDIIGVKALVVGATSTFGRGGRGTPELLEEIGPGLALKIRIVPPVTYKAEVISSTLIRKVLHKGDLEAVREMLGRPFSILATVSKGRGLGQKLGFPTANLDLKDAARPPDGIYLTYARINGSKSDSRALPSLTYIGPRPAFICAHPSPVQVCEVHILDFEGDVLSKEMEVVFLEKLRDAKKFKSASELTRQISRDVKIARRLFAKFAD